MTCLEVILLAAAVALGLFLIALPVKMAAAAVGADRTGVFWCLLSLVVASALHGVGLAVPVFGSIVAFLLASAGFAVILGTGFLRGMVIAVLHAVFGFLLAFALLALFGLSLGSLSLGSITGT